MKEEGKYLLSSVTRADILLIRGGVTPRIEGLVRYLSDGSSTLESSLQECRKGYPHSGAIIYEAEYDPASDEVRVFIENDSMRVTLAHEEAHRTLGAPPVTNDGFRNGWAYAEAAAGALGLYRLTGEAYTNGDSLYVKEDLEPHLHNAYDGALHYRSMFAKRRRLEPLDVFGCARDGLYFALFPLCWETLLTHLDAEDYLKEGRRVADARGFDAVKDFLLERLPKTRKYDCLPNPLEESFYIFTL